MIITIADIKSLFGITVQTDDHILAILSQGIESKVALNCNRTFESTVLTEYYDGDGTSVLQLKNYPIITVSAIYDDTDRVYDASSLISSDDYVIKETEGRIELDGLTFMQGLKNIKIVYTAGYSSATMPFDLKVAVAKLVLADYLEIKGGINVIEGQDFFYKPDKLRKEAQKTLDSYIVYGSNT